MRGFEVKMSDLPHETCFRTRFDSTQNSLPSLRECAVVMGYYRSCGDPEEAMSEFSKI